MNGAFAKFARRRAISVLPTPVGPIIRMFFGVTSFRNAGSSCIRRQRSRNAIATARLAFCWPTMKRSSSLTISLGVNSDMLGTRDWGPGTGRSGASWQLAESGGNGEATRVRKESWCPYPRSPVPGPQLFDRNVVVGVDADVARDAEGPFHDLAGVQIAVLEQRAGRRQRIGSAGADRDQAVLGFEHVAVAGDQQRCILVDHGD